jgi:hypothetical protein
VLGATGLQLINLGIVGNTFLALVSGLPPERRSLFGRLLLNRRFTTASWQVGAACCAGAVLLNYRTIVQYLTLRAIFVHWSYIITGATLFLVGAQLCMAGGLLVIARWVADRQTYLRQLDADEH